MKIINFYLGIFIENDTDFIESSFSPMYFLKKFAHKRVFLSPTYTRFLRSDILCFLLFSMVVVAISTASAEPTPTPAPKEEEMNIVIPVAEGQDVLGIRIPHFNINNELILLITAEVTRRIDDENLDMKNMKIENHNDRSNILEVILPRAQFNLKSHVLSGNTGATIKRKDFILEGQNLEFNLTTQSGVMKGDVTMKIKQIDKFTQ